jgi:hypothetical protein
MNDSRSRSLSFVAVKTAPQHMKTPAGLVPYSPQGFHELSRGFIPGESPGCGLAAVETAPQFMKTPAGLTLNSPQGFHELSRGFIPGESSACGLRGWI